MRVDVLKDAGDTTLTQKFYDDGTQVDPGTATVQVYNAAGTDLTSGATATTKTGTGPTAAFQFTLEAAWLAELDQLRIEWTRADTSGILTDYADIIGGVLFTEVRARAFDDAELADTTKYPDAAIAEERRRITDQLEQWTGRSWVPRYCRRELAGNGQRQLWLNTGFTQTSTGAILERPGSVTDVRRLISVTVGGVAVAVSNVKAMGRKLHRTDTSWPTPTDDDPLNVVLEYVYGVEPGIDGSDRAALLELVDRLPTSRLSRAATQSTDELGSYTWDPQNSGRQSRVPEVNAWIRDHPHHLSIA